MNVCERYLSEKEISSYLLSEGFDKDKITSIIDNLTDEGIISDMTMDWLADIADEYKQEV